MTNLNRPDLEDRGMDGFRARRAQLAQAAGAKQIGMSLWSSHPAPGAWGLLPPNERQRFIRHAATFVDENADPTMYEIELASLADATTPALLTAGAASPPLFEPILERLAATLPRAKRHRFPEAGHLPHITHPDEYLDAITDFASRTTWHRTGAAAAAGP